MKAVIELSAARVVASSEARGPEAKAIQVLIEEVAKRTGITWTQLDSLPSELQQQPLIIAGTVAGLASLILHRSELEADIGRLQPEGFILHAAAQAGTPIIYIIGKDARGVLYGVGRFLRKAVMREQSIGMSVQTHIVSSPSFPIRGHQLGYRPKTNAYDAWSVEQYEQYIRELALFGANSIEILPPRTDDDATGPLMKVDPLQMMIQLSAIIDSYGLKVWIWYPNMAEDYSDPEVRREELAEREEIFSKLSRIDAVMIPGSDPGGMHPVPLFEWSGELSELLQRYHPQARIWLSPQVMKYEPRPWLEAFYEQVNQEPEWLGGVVYGPHIDELLPVYRERIPQKYRIRRYEDITHNYHCQYPVADWDLALAMTAARESYNPRPLAEKHIHNQFAAYADGNISYSEGINDDVNKFVWSDQDWNPDTPVIETLRDFARLFIGSEVAEGVAQGLLALEQNWVGPLIINDQVEVTLQQWMQMEQEGGPQVLNQYRFQMGLIRAYYDAYVKRRLIYETELEHKAKDLLRDAGRLGSLNAVEQAERVLEQANTAPVAQGYKQRCCELADELFANIGSQLTVERHFAIAVDRGAFMDTIDAPLNDANWLRTQFRLIRGLDDEQARLLHIRQALSRTNPGPGGSYDNLGSYRSAGRVDPGMGGYEDPGYLYSPRVAPSIYLLRMNEEKKHALGGVPLAWAQHVNALADTPIHATYQHLDPDSAYTVKVAYVGDTVDAELSRDCWVRLTVNDHYVLQDDIHVREGMVTIHESSIPQEALADGQIKLTFQRIRGFKRLNVAEIWIIRQPVQL
ncbi:alpha-glucuronidase family glycosyl hydrolase [Paenibacillus periandrae]|uniref:alpha-glucuronidase family glycosyl hydrolase n=1 Tax=Paenibacillus periandrae TaxID=1761741 RepID=UPI001F09393A|nr:alpha-glucuronidase family glycosyl hydrolase [Paenibacillus periandrae]